MYFYWPFHGGLLLWIFFLLMFRVCHAILSSIYCSLVVTCLERADLLALLYVVIYCVLSLPDGVSRVKCGTWVYPLLIFAFFLTLRNESKIILCFKRWPKNCCLAHMHRKLFKFGGGGRGGGREHNDVNFNTCGGILQKMNIPACMRTHINVHMKTHVHAPKCSYSHACMHACMHTHMYACMHMQIHQNIYLFKFWHENQS